MLIRADLWVNQLYIQTLSRVHRVICLEVGFLDHNLGHQAVISDDGYLIKKVWLKWKIWCLHWQRWTVEPLCLLRMLEGVHATISAIFKVEM